MKKLFLLTSVFCQLMLNAQDWQSIPNSYFGTCCNFVDYQDFIQKSFRINSYTNDIWTAYANSASVIRTDGTYHQFTAPEVPLFSGFNAVLDFAFTSTDVYCITSKKGLFRYQSGIWGNVIPDLQCSSIATDTDTVWVTQSVDSNHYRYDSNGGEEGNYNKFERSAHRNGFFWGSSGPTGFLGRLINGVYQSYKADTSLLLSVKNYHFKFSPYSDSLYVAGDLGLSVAYQNKFIDSICPYSSMNMPSPGIIEFEFDKQNNIWALFGTESGSFTWNNTGIGYYDQSTRTWTEYYDGSNSPINFSHMLSIEVDTNSNLWVVQKDTLHVLKRGLTPAWLELADQKNNTFSLAPNPGSHELQMQFKQAVPQNSRVQIRDLLGKTVLETQLPSGVQQFALETSVLAPGCYVVSLNDGSSSHRWVKQ